MTLDLGGKGFVWFAVTAVDPAHDRPLAEVKTEVLAAWTTEETRKRLVYRTRTTESKESVR